MVRWGIIGVGRVAEQMATAINASPSATLTAVAGRDPARAADFAGRHSTDAVSDVEQLADEVDVVYVASPNALHLEHVQIAASHGAHILCEKPLANTPAEARQIVSICREARVRLGMGVQYRQHPAHRAMRDAITSGEIGAPVFADAAVHLPPMPTPQWYQDQKVAAGGVIPMSGVHRIDLLRYVLDADVVAVSALLRTRATGRPYEDTVAALLEFDNGTIATLRFAMEARSDGEGISVNGQDGWLRAERTTSSWWSDQPAALLGATTGGSIAQEFATVDLYRRQVDEFSTAVTENVPFSSTGVDGVRAAEITEAIHLAAERGQRTAVARVHTGIA
jgi:1,5-anhydro-D-fructose reductase (1,5-anhydro-D-mannitol-forming)